MRLLIINFTLGFFFLLSAASSSGFVKNLKGETIVLRDKQTIILKVADKIFEGDTIKTKNKSSIGIIFKDNTLISLGSNSEFYIKKYEFVPAKKKYSFLSRLVKGTMTCLTGLMSKLNPDAMKLEVKSASIGIRGTHFAVSVD